MKAMCRQISGVLCVLALCLFLPRGALASQEVDRGSRDDLGHELALGLDLTEDELEPLEVELASEARNDFAGDLIFTSTDRIKAVQPKLVLKKRRLELSPAFGLSVNDPYYIKVGAGLAAVLWLADSLGVSADVSFIEAFETDNVLLARRAYQSTILEPRLSFLSRVGFQWSPIFGKVAWLNRDIVHFDLFFTGGFGVAGTATGHHATTSVGVGQRYFFNRWLALFFKVENHLFPTLFSLGGGQVSNLSNLLQLSFGASFYLPTRFDYSIE